MEASRFYASRAEVVRGAAVSNVSSPRGSYLTLADEATRPIYFRVTVVENGSMAVGPCRRFS
jgi:hypothetical protein